MSNVIMMLRGFYPIFQIRFWPYWLAMALALVALVKSHRYPWLMAGVGGFLLGQMLGNLWLVGWELVPLFWLSAALAALLAVFSLAALRPVITLASFIGVGFLAYTLSGMLGLPSPWSLVVYALAGAVAVVLLFTQPYAHQFIVNAVLSATGLIIATLLAWIPYFTLWNGASAVIIGVIAVIVGLVAQFRELSPVVTTLTVEEAPALQ